MNVVGGIWKAGPVHPSICGARQTDVIIALIALPDIILDLPSLSANLQDRGEFGLEAATEAEGTAVMDAAESLKCAKSVVRKIIAARHDRPSLVSDIACAIGAEIAEGLLPPGTDLNSVELSQRYETSRTPVREALMLLEKEGLVDIPPRRRPRVMVHDIDEIREIYRVRALLIESLAGDVVRLASEAELDEFDRIVDSMSAAAEIGDLNSYMWCNVAFHDYNATVARNKTVKRMIDSLLLRTLRLRRLSLSQPARLAESLDDHRRVAAAYRGRDAKRAAALLRSNHISALARLEATLL